MDRDADETAERQRISAGPLMTMSLSGMDRALCYGLENLQEGDGND
jgi:hypothetical protein